MIWIAPAGLQMLFQLFVVVDVFVHRSPPPSLPLASAAGGGPECHPVFRYLFGTTPGLLLRDLSNERSRPVGTTRTDLQDDRDAGTPAPD
jgi:hypothetical protein